MGLAHELAYWGTSHATLPPLVDQWERDYDPAELGEDEGWIAKLFEPVRKSFFDGPQPPPMQFMVRPTCTQQSVYKHVLPGSVRLWPARAILPCT